MTRLRLIIALLLGTIGICLAAGEAESTATLKSLTEKRSVSFAKEPDPFASFHQGLELTVHFKGPALLGAGKYKPAVFTKAVDDLGTDLAAVPKGGMTMYSGFQDIPFDEGKKPEGFDRDLSLPVTPPRNATMIQTIAGSMDFIVGGEKKEIEVTDLQGRFGKLIDDPSLKAAGLKVTILDPAKRPAAAAIFGGSHVVAVSIAGDPSVIDDVKILSADGKSISSGNTSSELDGKRYVNYMLDGNPKLDGAVMKLIIYPGQKTVTVPFKFDKVKLP